uniref:Uncharacterized protein n=1 Tax=Romanomermis culicivorax TaxID=13658 RepID=A0A915KRE1_ROMCU
MEKHTCKKQITGAHKIFHVPRLKAGDGKKSWYANTVVNSINQLPYLRSISKSNPVVLKQLEKTN